MQVQSRTKKIIKSGTILILAIIVIIGISAGLGAIGFPFWPFSLFLFFYTAVDKSDPHKLKGTAISGAIGIAAGMSQGIVTQTTGNPTLGVLALALCVLVLGTAFIMGDVSWAKVFGLLLLNMITLFPQDPCVWAGVPDKSSMGWLESFARVMGSYLIVVFLFVGINAVVKRKKAVSQFTD